MTHRRPYNNGFTLVAAIIFSACGSAPHPSTTQNLAVHTEAMPAPSALHAQSPQKLPVSPRIPTNPATADVPAVDPQHAYTLAELIDRAESSNPSTRSAWERAKQAQQAVGAARAAYLPILSASVLAGYQHTQYPITQIIVPKGYFSVDTHAVVPTLSLKWLLFDFGSRAADVDALSSLSGQTTELFQLAHRKVVFDVTVAYHRLNARLAQLSIANDNVERTQKLADAVHAKRERGLATDVEATLARRDVTQVEYERVQQQALVRSAESELLRAIGADPAGHISIEPRKSGSLPVQTKATLEQCVRVALERRADVKAAFLQVQAAQARVAGARSMFFPRVGVIGAVSEQFVGTSIDGSNYFNDKFPTASVFAQLEWQLLDGGLRSSQLAAAQSRLIEAQHELTHVKSDAIHQVVEAYNEANASIDRYNAAQALLEAASVAATATDEAFAAGMVTLSDMLRAQSVRSQAKTLAEQAYYESLIAAASLAFAIVEITPQ